MTGKNMERRAALYEMCHDLGCSMLTREDNDHAKAGNINTALPKTEGDLVLILDCDHIPTRTFLTETVGFFANDEVALVQTPHWFYNPDPFERNLLTSGRVPVGNELFYKVLQRGNDYWNSAFFCGSAAIIRRDRLLEVGGIATETVTEDCHTSLRLHASGYQTIYYDKIMVAGLAPEKFSSYVGQQIRWARGMAQILRLENPLFNRKLNLRIPQRICYFSATSHFFFGFPRLMYAIAPALFLLFGINSVKGLGIETLVYALPHIFLSMQANHIPYKHVRFSFWNEIYEFAMSFQAGIVTILALVNPRMGQFNVTSKGLTVNTRSFDLESVRYLVILGAVTGASLMAVPFWLIISPEDTQAVLINMLWCSFNLLLVVAACLVAFEQPQLRRAHRLPRQIQAIIHGDDGSWHGQTLNISETGAKIELDLWPNISDQVRVELVGDLGARALLDAQIIRAIATDTLQTHLTIDFINVSRTQMDDLAVVIYSDVREWYAQRRRESDNPFESLHFIATSLKRAFKEFRPESGVKVRKQVRATAQLFWEGWDGYSYTAKITEMGTRDLRLEFSGNPILNLETLETEQPLIALSLNLNNDPSTAQSLLAQIESVEMLAVFPGEVPFHRVALELSFPEELKSQQQNKIKRVLRSLGSDNSQSAASNQPY
jgi:cellulose synthase (UDP-forming)